MPSANSEQEKALAAARAVAEIQAGMLVGLGTGSTTAYAVRELGRRVAAGLKIEATATSHATEALAQSLGIPIKPFGSIARVDLAIDGADEIDPQLRAIKGGGGALLREKIVATSAARMLAMVDSSKAVPQLGRFGLPVEVLPFAQAFVQRAVAELSITAKLRQRPDGSPILTDQGNLLLDLEVGLIADPQQLATHLSAIPGILEQGLFLTEIDGVFIGRGDEVEFIERDIIA